MDRYLAAAVLEAYVATAAAFFVITVVFDLLVNLGGYARSAQDQLALGTFAFARLLAEYYACFAPVLFLNYAPYVTVVACMFGVTKLTAANELLPMLFSGRSMYRALAPAVAIAVLSAGGMAAVWEFGGGVVDRWFALRDVVDRADTDSAIRHVLVRSGDRGEKILHCARYQPADQTMRGVVLLDRGDGNGGTEVVRASAARWDDGRAVWQLEDGWRRSGNREVPIRELSLPGVVPDTVLRLGRSTVPEHVLLLSYSEIELLRALRPGRHDLVLAYHAHFATPLSCVVLVLLTLSLAVSFERGSRVGRVIAAFFVCAAYLVFDLTCRNLGLRQFLDPVVAAWTPVIVFGALGVLSYTGIKT
ncbi:MAG TPA: LptF/LptG family permease [Planctomycetota bacterium]|nr:LptF/LptG family permease [Planctomycetota bacterium]